MHEEVIDHFQEMMEQMATALFNEVGKLYPMAVVLGQNTNGKYQHHVIQLDTEFLNTAGSKDHLTDEVIPGILLDLKEKKSEPICLATLLEVWMKTAPFNSKEDIDTMNFKTLKVEKKEAVVICFETKNKSWMATYYINRLPGNRVTLDKVQKEPLYNIGGRFSGLFKKAKEHEQRKKN